MIISILIMLVYRSLDKKNNDRVLSPNPLDFLKKSYTLQPIMIRSQGI
jgi:hypothetical protein